jgi:hypothetical protein
MAIFAWQDIGDQVQGGLIDHERLSRQSMPDGLTQGFESMLAGCKTVPIDTFDPLAPEPMRGALGSFSHWRLVWKDVESKTHGRFPG